MSLARRHGDYALCGVAALVTTDHDGAVTTARVALISVGPVPVVVDVGAAVHGTGTAFDTERSRGCSTPPSTPRPTSTPPPSTAATWPTCWPHGP